MKMPLGIMLLLAAILWTSALTMFVVGSSMQGLWILRWAAIPDAVLALAFTVLAAQKWSSGSK